MRLLQFVGHPVRAPMRRVDRRLTRTGRIPTCQRGGRWVGAGLRGESARPSRRWPRADRARRREPGPEIHETPGIDRFFEQEARAGPSHRGDDHSAILLPSRSATCSLPVVSQFESGVSSPRAPRATLPHGPTCVLCAKYIRPLTQDHGSGRRLPKAMIALHYMHYTSREFTSRFA